MSTVLSPHMRARSPLTRAMERSGQLSSPVGYFQRLIYIQAVLKYSVCACVCIWYPEGVSPIYLVYAVLCALRVYYIINLASVPGSSWEGPRNEARY